MISFCVFLMCFFSNALGRNDPSMRDMLVEYDLPRTKDLRRLLDGFYQDNPFIYKNIGRCEDRQLMWYAKCLARNIEGTFCPKAVSSSENRFYADRQQLYAMMISDRQKIIGQQLIQPTPSPLIEHTPFPIDESTQKSIESGFSACHQKIENIHNAITKNPSMSVSERQILKNELLGTFMRLCTESDYVLKQSIGIPYGHNKKVCKNKINLLSQKSPEKFTESDLWSLFHAIQASVSLYQKPVQGMVRALRGQPVTHQNIVDAVQRIQDFYHSLTAPQKNVCDQLIYLTMLEALSHIQKSCILIVDQKERWTMHKAIFNMYDTLYKEKQRLVGNKDAQNPTDKSMITYLVPSAVFSTKYSLWKSYLDDLMVALGTKMHNKDFCANVNRYCQDACDKIESDLSAQKEQFQKDQEK